MSELKGVIYESWSKGEVLAVAHIICGFSVYFPMSDVILFLNMENPFSHQIQSWETFGLIYITIASQNIHLSGM